MKKNAVRACLAVACVLLTTGMLRAQGQPTAPVGVEVAAVLDSGEVSNGGKAWKTVFSQQLTIPGAAWVRLHFTHAVLPGASQVVVTSLRDGERQALDGAGVAMWSAATAYFNGDTVVVEIIASPGAGPCRVTIDRAEAEFGDPARGDPGQCGICGADDRTATTDDSVCRIMSVGCSGTVVCQDSTLISAGHCATGTLTAQVRVPASTSGCATVNPPVNDQFPITAYDFVNGGVGNDWSVMLVGVNGLGQKPYDRYGAKKSLASAPAVNGAAVGMHGFGVDTTCTRSQTLQESLGTITAVAATSYQFNADVRGGNSGSSLLSAGGTVIAIVTHCSVGCPNFGTRTDLAAFVTALNNRMVCDNSYAVAINSSPVTGAAVAVSPTDTGGLGNGVTNFGRTYRHFTTVTLTAPATLGARCFGSWTVAVGSAGSITPAGRAVTFQVQGAVTATANFVTTCCRADCDGNGLFQPADIACFVNTWSASLQGGTLAGDYDGNGVVAPADIASFITDWLTGVNTGSC